MTFQAFHGDAEFKAQLVEAAIRHRQSDEYAAGSYGAARPDGSFRGCSVGCSLYDVRRLRGIAVYDYSDHETLANALGVPEWLPLLQDAIFEGLPPDERVRFTERLFEALPVGADISPALHRIAIARMERLLHLADESEAWQRVVPVIREIRACHEAALTPDGCSKERWSAAEAVVVAEAAEAARSDAAARWAAAAAWSAGWSARAAAWSAEAAAEARSAGWSARAAAWSAEAAAEARSAQWHAEAESLLSALRECAV